MTMQAMLSLPGHPVAGKRTDKEDKETVADRLLESTIACVDAFLWIITEALGEAGRQPASGHAAARSQRDVSWQQRSLHEGPYWSAAPLDYVIAAR